MNIKTFADLKIGDVVYHVRGANITEEYVFGMSVSTPISIGTGMEKTKSTFSELRGCTAAATNFDAVIFTNESDAIVLFKDNAVKEIARKQEHIDKYNNDIEALRARLNSYK